MNGTVYCESSLVYTSWRGVANCRTDPVACTYTRECNRYPMLFMSNDTTRGPTFLASQAGNPVTGGNVTGCGVIRLTNALAYGMESCNSSIQKPSQEESRSSLHRYYDLQRPNIDQSD